MNRERSAGATDAADLRPILPEWEHEFFGRLSACVRTLIVRFRRVRRTSLSASEARNQSRLTRIGSGTPGNSRMSRARRYAAARKNHPCGCIRACTKRRRACFPREAETSRADLPDTSGTSTGSITFYGVRPPRFAALPSGTRGGHSAGSISVHTEPSATRSADHPTANLPWNDQAAD